MNSKKTEKIQEENKSATVKKSAQAAESKSGTSANTKKNEKK